MKKIITIFLFTIALNLSAQEKHSELYNQIDTICKTIFKDESRSKPLLIISGIPYNDYTILDSIDQQKKYSISIIKQTPSCRGSNGMILLQTKEEYDKQHKSKKRNEK